MTLLARNINITGIFKNDETSGNDKADFEPKAGWVNEEIIITFCETR